MLVPFFYIYRHIRHDTGEVFYVGKGSYTKRHKYDRAYAPHTRNRMWSAIVSKSGGYDVEIMMAVDTEDQAFSKEREFIALYGRRDKTLGSLCNLTDGGEGHLGISVSDEERKRKSQRVKGEKHPNWGKRLSVETRKKKSDATKGERHHLFGTRLPDEWRENIRKSRIGSLNPMYGRCGEQNPRSKKVINTTTGAAYGSISEAAKSEGISANALYQYLDGTRKNPTSLVKG